MKLAFKKLNADAIIPVRATAQSAGLDLCACINAQTTENLTYPSVNSPTGCLPLAYKDPKTDEWYLQIQPHATVLVPTGLAVAPIEYDTESGNDVVLLVYARSGLSTKHGINLANSVGVVDSDYRGEVKVALHNNTDIVYNVKHGERIAQMVVTPVLLPETIEVDELSVTERGEGGFGSSGK